MEHPTGTVSNCNSTSCTTTTQIFMGWWGGMGGPGHYVVTPTQVEVDLRLSWAVTISNLTLCACEIILRIMQIVEVTCITTLHLSFD